jgi:hypothetical protein
MLTILAGVLLTVPPVASHRQPWRSRERQSHSSSFSRGEDSRADLPNQSRLAREKLSRPDWPHQTISPVHAQA